MKMASDHGVEGRLIAHRQLLSLIVAALDGPAGADVRAFLEEHSVFQDGQEDPGAVATPEAAIGLAISDELRLISERSRGTPAAV